jgi:predicted Rossmann-fold nucleotide-binding protein
VVLYNVNGFWNPLLATVEEMSQAGFVRGEVEKYLIVANSVAELEDLIRNN